MTKEFDEEKMFMNVINLFEYILNEFELKTLPENHTLESHLMAYTKEKLMRLAKKNGMKIQSKWKKAELAETLTEELLNSIELRFLLLGYDKLLLLKHFTKADQDSEMTEEVLMFYLEVFREAVFLGLVFPLLKEGDIVSAIPLEIKEKLEEAIANYEHLEEKYNEDLKHWERLESVITAAVNLYGVTTYSQINALWEIKYPGSLKTINQITDYLDRNKNAISFVTIKNNFSYVKEYFIASPAFDDESEAVDFYNYCNDKLDRDYYKPTAKEIDYYSKHMFDRKSSYYKKLKQTVSKITSNVSEIMRLIEGNILFSGETSDLLDEMSSLKHVAFSSEKQFNRFISQFTDLNNHSRIWENGGYTPEELFKKHTPFDEEDNVIPLAKVPRKQKTNQQVEKVEKVGRNDPCPCGSGKKYKKCCWGKEKEPWFLQ